MQWFSSIAIKGVPPGIVWEGMEGSFIGSTGKWLAGVKAACVSMSSLFSGFSLWVSVGRGCLWSAQDWVRHGLQDVTSGAGKLSLWRSWLTWRHRMQLGFDVGRNFIHYIPDKSHYRAWFSLGPIFWVAVPNIFPWWRNEFGLYFRFFVACPFGAPWGWLN